MSVYVRGSVQFISVGTDKTFIGMSFSNTVPIQSEALLGCAFERNLAGFQSFLFPSTEPTIAHLQTAGLLMPARTTSLTSSGAAFTVPVELSFNFTPNGSIIASLSCRLSRATLTTLNNSFRATGNGFVFLHVMYPPLLEMLAVSTPFVPPSGFKNVSWLVSMPDPNDNYMGPPTGASSGT